MPPAIVLAFGRHIQAAMKLVATTTIIIIIVCAL